MTTKVRPRYQDLPLWARDQEDAHRRNTAGEQIRALDTSIRFVAVLCVMMVALGIAVRDRGFIAVAMLGLGAQLCLAVERVCWGRWRRHEWPWR